MMHPTQFKHELHPGRELKKKERKKKERRKETTNPHPTRLSHRANLINGRVLSQIVLLLFFT